MSSIHVMAKPAGPSCNLACDYCYYIDKSGLYPKASHMMPDDILERFISSYIAAQTGESVMFTWHGGEPLLRGRKFYERVLELQQRYANGRIIDNCLQTNGTLITPDWCKFFRDNNFLIGLSIDGPSHLHDRYRRDISGHPSFMRVEKAAGLLNSYGVEWNAMATVNNANANFPLEFYRFFRDTIECRYLQFTPIVERLVSGNILPPDASGGRMAPFSVTPRQWGEFLCKIFDEWVRHDVGNMFVQIFDSTLANWLGVPPGVCTLAPECGHALVMEFNGDVYSCDHFVFPDHYLGNIRQSAIKEMAGSRRQSEFAEKSRTLNPKCRACRYLFACNGECPKNRISTSPGGSPGLNYLCSGYYRFFAHSEEAMLYMKNEYLSGRSPANIMYSEQL